MRLAGRPGPCSLPDRQRLDPAGYLLEFSPKIGAVKSWKPFLPTHTYDHARCPAGIAAVVGRLVDRCLRTVGSKSFAAIHAPRKSRSQRGRAKIVQAGKDEGAGRELIGTAPAMLDV